MKRLFEDPTLDSELRAELLRSQRAGRDYDVDGKLSAMRQALQDMPPGAGELEQGTTSSLGAGLSKLAPLPVKLVVLAAVGGAAVYFTWPEPVRPEVRARPAPEASPVERSLTSPKEQPRLAVSSPAPAPAPPPKADPAPAADTDVAAAPAPAPSAAAAPPSSRREIAQLVRIRALLESDPRAAYRLAERGEREFARGVLSEERRALQVLALAKSGDLAAATARSREFFASYPQSPMRELVEAALRR